jgi:putative ubiquitin-RnfH superfamily antitoxin RatB of RatAB toxin-antitoxin module
MAALRVEVVYALPEAEDAVTLGIPGGATLLEAVQRSGVLGRHPEIDPGALRIGVFGKLRPANALAEDGDRIEIYRPLSADPKEARRARARKSRAAKR